MSHFIISRIDLRKTQKLTSIQEDLSTRGDTAAVKLAALPHQAQASVMFFTLAAEPGPGQYTRTVQSVHLVRGGNLTQSPLSLSN